VFDVSIQALMTLCSLMAPGSESLEISFNT
jgi:hypothetical protein